ncbi:substrate-binding domain-containing protein [Fictibacillus enclensis]|uniref:substrate-binding domain-containing protein n=1 Tax=Fictibacillus enclensis TaxID=1017270 RepID=UPI0024BFD433|nr:substrate-binding domain-containing protein [Fictibacillus enclensis]WHY71913.1 substrate-binding domain-containing protein [Fictibacillus enclensis]
MAEYVSKANREDKGMIFTFSKRNQQFVYSYSHGPLLDQIHGGQEITGKTVFDLYKNAPDLAHVIHEYYEMAWNGEYVEYEVHFRDKEYLTSLRPVADQGTVAQVVGICTDITLQKEQERKLAHAMARSDFLSKMSHELRTPLNGILGFAQLLELEEDLTDTQYDFVQEILNGGRHLLELVNEVLDLSRIETGNLKIAITEVELLTVLQECVKIVNPMAKKKNITIDVQRDHSNTTMRVLADPVRLKQIFLNLLNNAIKYNREFGKVYLYCHQEGDHQVIQVEDTGVGFSASEYNKVFVPFYRIEGSKEEGTGIGLSLVKQLVNLMDGKISVTSTKGKGSNFKVTLPVPPNLKTGVRWGENVEPDGTDMEKTDVYRLLYIEDNESNIHLVQNILNPQPAYSLLVARTAKEGLALLAHEKVDMILLDINLPDMDGYEMIDIIRASDAAKDTAVIAVSSMAASGNIQQALDRGFDHYVTKPINVKEFLTVINDVLNNTIHQNIPDARIYSTGPHGEQAVSAKTLQLSLEDLKKINEKKYRAAISMHYAGNDWARTQVEGLTVTFERMGIEVIAVTNAEFNWEKQVADIDGIVAKQPDILVSIPVDSIKTAKAYQKAAQSGIKLIFMENTPEGLKHGEDYVSIVSADHYGNGEESAHIMGEQLKGRGSIGVIYYEGDFFSTRQRTTAFEKTIKEHYPGIRIVERVGIKGPDGGEEATACLLDRHPGLNGVFVVWDIPAEGAMTAARKAGRDDLVITTTDLGIHVALDMARDGLIKGLGAQLPYQQGVAEAILAGYALLGRQAPPYVAVPALKVTQRNMLEAWKLVYNMEVPERIQNALQEKGR